MEKVEKKVEKTNEYVVEAYGIKLRLTDEELKKTSELTSEDIDAMRKVKLCTLKSSKNRAGNRQYSFTVHLVLNEVMITKYVDASEFKRILVSHGLPVDLTRDLKDVKIPCSIRYIHGNSSTTGEKYFAYQLFPYGNKSPLVRRTMGCGFEFLHEKEIVDMAISKVTFKNPDNSIKEVKSFNELVLFRKTTEVVDDAESVASDEYYD